MKRYTYLYLPFLVFVSACGPESSDDNNDTTIVEKNRIHSDLVFSRGQEAGQRALAFERDSKEREAELLRAYAIISALENKGYLYSAADFKAGLDSQINKTE